MKQPSARARKSIDALQTLMVAEDGTIKSTLSSPEIETAIELLRALDGQTDLAKQLSNQQFSIIPFLLPFTLAPQTNVAQLAADIVERQLQTISSLHLLQLQDRLRGGVYNTSARLSKWNQIKFEQLAPFYANNPRLAAMASFHHNGFVREAAIKYLDQQQSGVELPYLLIRLTDWVGPVSTLAKTTLEHRLKKNYWHHFVDNLLLIELLSAKKRGSEPDTIAAGVFAKVHSALKAPENRSHLIEGLKASTWETRRMCLRLLKIIRAETALEDGTEASKKEKASTNARQIIDAVLAEKDVTNRLLIFDFADDLSIPDQIDLMIQLGKDTAPSIRRNALEVLCQIDAASTLKNLERGLLDRSPLVREFSRFRFIQTGKAPDFRQFYLDKLHNKVSAKIIASSIAGLGEVGDESDVEILLPFFAHPQVSVRRFATLALGKLAPVGHDEVFLAMLNQPAVGLSRAATTVISSLPEPVEAAHLLQIFEETQWKHVKLNATRLFNSLPKWVRIAYLLKATGSTQSEVKKLATTYVESWVQRYRTSFQFSLPGLNEQTEFVQAYQAADHIFNSQTEETLKACLALCEDKK